MINKLITNIELKNQNSDVNFSLKLMEDIYDASDGKNENPHRHNYYSIIWPTKTVNGFHIIDFNEYQIKKDGLFFIQPGQVHQISTNEKPFGFVILFSSDFLTESKLQKSFIDEIKVFNSFLKNEPLFIQKKKSEKLREFISSICDAVRTESKFRDEAIGAYLKLFLIECSSVCDADIQREDVKSKLILNDFKKLVEKNYFKEHKVKFYSDRLVISAGHLNYTIKNEIGLTAKDYIQKRIALESKRLVLFSNSNAKEIAFELGFNDPHHFSKFFKKHTGFTITEFINNNQKNF